MWERIKSWCKHSLTVAWGYLQIVGGAVGAALGSLGTIITDGEVKSAIQALGLNPKWMLAFAVAGVVTVMCRLRTVGHATDARNQVTDA